MNIDTFFLLNFVFTILPWITCSVFMLGLIFRITKWLSGVSEYRVPISKKAILRALTKSLILDCLLHYKLLRSNVKLWLIEWPMIVAVFLAFISHLQLLGIELATLLCRFLPFLGPFLLLEVTLLIIHEITSQDTRSILTLSDIIFYFLLFLAVFSGNVIIFSPRTVTNLTLPIFGFPFVLEKAPFLPWLLFYCVVIQLFIMSLPFTKLPHMIALPIIAFSSRLEQERRYGYKYD